MTKAEADALREALRLTLLEEVPDYPAGKVGVLIAKSASPELPVSFIPRFSALDARAGGRAS